MSVDVECIVVGAGVIGLAVARQLARKGCETLILDSAANVGSGISSRNSEVIHAGIYYAPGSLKARMCREGKEMLYDFCESRAISYHRCGKLVVADSQSQLSDIAEIAARAKANDVLDIQTLSAQAVSRLEPEVSCVGGLFSPSTGIIDSHALMLSLLGEAENEGAVLCLSTKVTSISEEHGHILVNTNTEQGGYKIRCKYLINAAGLSAVGIASSCQSTNVRPVMAKGNYFRLIGKSPFQRLVYPVPEPGGLGVHTTIDLQGFARFGPDVQWVNAENYEVDETLEATFRKRVSQYWPAIAGRTISPDYAGIRSKIVIDNKLYPDFLFQGSESHGVRGLINCLGIESPGLTSCLAIANYVQEQL